MRMGLGDLVGKAKDALEQHGDKVSDGLETAGDFVKSKTPDTVDGHVDKAVDSAQDYIAKQQKNESTHADHATPRHPDDGGRGVVASA